MATHYGVEVNLTDGLEAPRCRFVDSALEEPRGSSYRITSPPPPNFNNDHDNNVLITMDSREEDSNGYHNHSVNNTSKPLKFSSAQNIPTKALARPKPMSFPSPVNHSQSSQPHFETSNDESFIPAISSLFDSLGLGSNTSTTPDPSDEAPPHPPPPRRRPRNRQRRKSRLEGRQKIPKCIKFSKQQLDAQRYAFNSQKRDVTPYAELEGQFGQPPTRSTLHSGTPPPLAPEFWNVSPISSSIVTQEIRRENWTWSTAFSPDGTKLALTSENSPLIILDTTSLPVWNIIYCGSYKPPHTPHWSVRSIAWGQNLIALGGTGEVVVLLDPLDFQIRHVLPSGGYICALDWKIHSNILVVGSRNESCKIYRVVVRKQIKCELLHVITRENWVNVVKFSPLGGLLAIGDRNGSVLIYTLYETRMKAKLNFVTEYDLEQSVLSLSWSHDGKLLIIGSEDRRIHIVHTLTWNIIQQIPRSNWVFCASASNTSSYLAMGGCHGTLHFAPLHSINSSYKSISCHSPVLLDAQWHPHDSYLSLAGQDGTVQVVDLHRSNQAQKHAIPFASGIQSLSLSSDGTFLTVAKQDGIVSFVDRAHPKQILYEVMAPCSNSPNPTICVEWAPQNSFVAIGAGNVVLILGLSKPKEDDPILYSKFGLQKMITDIDTVTSINFSPDGKYMVVNGTSTRLYNIPNNFTLEHTFLSDSFTLSSSWSPDGAFFAVLQSPPKLTIYECSSIPHPSEWNQLFDLTLDSETTSLSWGPTNNTHTLYYLAYGGKTEKITVMEIRSKEQCWEHALVLPCPGRILDMDWRKDGMLAIGCTNGSAMIVNLHYLFTGTAVYQMDYKWQRQGITCSVLMERKSKEEDEESEMTVVRWLSPNATQNHVLVVGGSDGIVETIDLS